MILRADAAVITHFDQSGVVGIRVHPVFPIEFFNDFLDGGFHAKRTAAFNAFKRILAMQRLLIECLFAKAELRLERDGSFWACVGTQTTLHAGVFDNIDLRAI